ncbi:cytochrome P450 [Phlegmacium glaucopus]|nr:cytochrome P450 [Phlegmacium glaucopus]
MPLFSHSGTLFTVAGIGLLVHTIFKLTEPHSVLYLFALLFATPASLTVLYLPHAINIIHAVRNVFGLFWLVLASSILVYRISPWHPLAKHPGPLICKLTKFRLAFISLGGKQHIYYDHLHQKYGDVVRVGPNELSIRNVNAITPLMGSSGFHKGPFWEGRFPKNQPVQSLIAIRNKQEHMRRRQPWTRAFSTSALKDYETMVKNRSLQLVEMLLAKGLKETVDLSKYISHFSYDVMSDLTFSGGSEMMQDGDVDGLRPLLEDGQRNSIFMSHVPWLGAIALSLPIFAEGIKAFRAFAQRCAFRRLQEGSLHKDLFYHLINEDNNGGYKPSVGELLNDSGLAIIAGSDTTASAISNLIYFLMFNPTAFKRLQAEVDELGEDLMDYAKQAHLPYLNACLNETLRLLPPVLSGSQRTPEKGTGGKMAGLIFVPEGTNVFVPTYCIHRDARCFSPFPDSFLPERWLPEDQRLALEPKVFNSQNEYIHNTTAFLAFSIGQANCAGKNLAWMEMRMLVCLMISRLDIKPDPSYKPNQWYDDLCDYFVMMRGSLPTLISSRQSVTA